MKKLTSSLVLLGTLAFKLSAHNEEELEKLKNACFKGRGNIEACSIIIDSNPELDEIRKKLVEEELIEAEKLGIPLRIHYTAFECESNSEEKRKKSARKFVKQVMRMREYKK